MDESCEYCAKHPRPTAPLISLGGPGEPLRLFEGDLHAPSGASSRSTAPGTVEMTWRRRTHLTWEADLSGIDPVGERQWRVARTAGTLGFDWHGIPSSLATYLLTTGRGWTNGGFVGNPNAMTSSVTAHWVCIPDLGGTVIHQHNPTGGWRTWNGRALFQVHGWTLTLDSRQDHRDVYRRAVADEQVVITHVMDLRRTDGSEFTAHAAMEILDGVQMAVSFALGRWVSPAAPTGLNARQEPLWARWRPTHAAPPRRGLGWWSEGRVDPDLDHLLDVFLASWLKPDIREAINVPMASAILATDTGFVEQRLVSAVAGIEKIAWMAETGHAGLPKTTWAKPAKGGWQRIDRLLATANINTTMGQSQTPALLAYTKANHSTTNGARGVAEVRNRVVHPKDDRDLYADGQILGEASRLALRYLELLLLHLIGYHGETEDRTDLHRWGGDSEPVPWPRSPSSE